MLSFSVISRGRGPIHMRILSQLPSYTNRRDKTSPSSPRWPIFHKELRILQAFPFVVFMKKKKRYRNVWLHKTKLPHIHPLCLYNFKVFPFCREWEPLWLMWVFFPCFFSTSRTNYAIKISIKDGTSIQNTYSD